MAVANIGELQEVVTQCSPRVLTSEEIRLSGAISTQYDVVLGREWLQVDLVSVCRRACQDALKYSTRHLQDLKP